MKLQVTRTEPGAHRKDARERLRLVAPRRDPKRGWPRKCRIESAGRLRPRRAQQVKGRPRRIAADEESRRNGPRTQAADAEAAQVFRGRP